MLRDARRNGPAGSVCFRAVQKPVTALARSKRAVCKAERERSALTPSYTWRLYPLPYAS